MGDKQVKYVIGVDLGTSSVKVLLVDKQGHVAAEASKDYPLVHEKAGYSEQDPEHWVSGTITALKQLVQSSGVSAEDIEGVSFSGQMHGLVLLDTEHKVIRPAILWNDTRTTEQCRVIEQKLGTRLLEITRNPALEGFTLPKILWVQQHEPEQYKKAAVFVLPKDYLRYRLTGLIQMEYSDAAGTLMLDIAAKQWSKELCDAVGISTSLCPPLVEPHAFVGTLLPEVADLTGLHTSTKIFAGGADNACGAIGAGILSEGEAMCSIGTSGVILSYENDRNADYKGKVHFFNHGKADGFYSMGVTLGAGYSLSWFKDTLAEELSFEELLAGASAIAPGAGGLLFTPYLVGERTPHADPNIRGSFIGLDGSHTRAHLTRAVLEGITFSLQESIDIFRKAGKKIDTVISIGGGAKSELWLQLQADIFNATVIRLENEQGPGMGAAMLAAYGCGWFDSLEQCAKVFIRRAGQYTPNSDRVAAYEQLFELYKQVYVQTKALNEGLMKFR
jgi:xylulokinase